MNKKFYKQKALIATLSEIYSGERVHGLSIHFVNIFLLEELHISWIMSIIPPYIIIYKYLYTGCPASRAQKWNFLYMYITYVHNTNNYNYHYDFTMIVNKSFDSTSRGYVMQLRFNNIIIKIVPVPHPLFYFQRSKVTICATTAHT